jgi:hypothetical protein
MVEGTDERMLGQVADEIGEVALAEIAAAHA